MQRSRQPFHHDLPLLLALDLKGPYTIMSRPHLTALSREIILHICCLLRKPDLWGAPQNQPSLAALALTCSYLSKPALDVLWNTIGSLVPLVAYTLPEDLCTIVPVTAEVSSRERAVKYYVIFHRKPVTIDFLRFSTYATRVKALRAEDNDKQLFKDHEIPFDVWTSLLLHGPQPLLPNLRTLYHSEIHQHNMYEPGIAGRGPLYRSEPLFSSQLSEVSLEFGDWSSDEWRPTEVVESLSYRSPLVENLTMAQPGMFYRHTLKHDLKMSARLSGSAIGTFLHLVKFESYWMYISPAALLSLGSLRKLQELVVHVDLTEYDWEAFPHGRHLDLFPALKKLVVLRPSIEWCIAFMNVITSPSLWRVRIRNEDSEPDALPDMLFEALCTSIANHPSSRNIGEVDLTIGRCNSMMPQVYQSRHIAPLLSLPALQKLAIHGHCLVIIDDAFLDAATWSWPDLQSLEIRWPHSLRTGLGSGGPRPGELDYPKATLAGVLLLARYCRRLTSLDFPVDIRKVPRLDERHPPVSLWPSYESPLERFCPSGPAFRVDDVQDLAMFLSVIFPKLQSFGFPRQDDSSSSRVMYMHRKFLTIRWQERRWMLANGRRFREPEPDPCSWEEGDEADLIQE